MRLEVRSKVNRRYSAGVEFAESGVRVSDLNLDLPFTGCVSLGKLLNLSAPQFPHL